VINNESALEAAISDFEEKHGVRRCIVTSTLSYATPGSLGIGTGGDVIILSIEVDSGINYFEMFTYGAPDNAITDSEVGYILDNEVVYNEIKRGDVGRGALRFVELCDKAYSGTLQESVSETVLISLVLAVIAAAIPVIIIVVKYKRKLKGASYPLERYATLYMHDDKCSDFFIGSFVTRTRINTSSGSRSGGGRMGGGGGSRGRR
jgi:hypothetical protein